MVSLLFFAVTDICFIENDNASTFRSAQTIGKYIRRLLQSTLL
jgi:hypothetical protein